MKILCVIDSLGSGGAQRQMVELAKQMKERGHEVFFLTYHEQDFYKGELYKNGIDAICINESNYLIRLIKMRRFIRKGRFDAVLSFLEASNFISEIAGFPWRKWKVIVGERSANPNIFKSFKLKGYRWFHLFADFIVANSHANLKIVSKLNPMLPASRCKVIYNMIDLEKWKPISTYKQREYGKLKLVIAASHRHLKNLNNLIEAVNLLEKEDHSKIIIEWYGDERDSSLKEGLSKIEHYKLDSIFEFFPATNKINTIMQKADAIGLFSFYEGLPNTVCEGMACGKPIIATAVSDVSILVTEKNGFLCEPEDINSISNALKNLINSSELELSLKGEKSRERAIELFDSKLIVEKYLKLIEQ